MWRKAANVWALRTSQLAALMDGPQISDDSLYIGWRFNIFHT
jgi:hypothetical protein